MSSSPSADTSYSERNRQKSSCSKKSKRQTVRARRHVKSKENLTLCAARNCRNCHEENTALEFYKFPKDRSRCYEWAMNIGREDLLHMFTSALHAKKTVCASHFEVSQFKKGTSKLIDQATPTLFNPKSAVCTTHSKNTAAGGSTKPQGQQMEQTEKVDKGVAPPQNKAQLRQLLTCTATVNCSKCNKEIWICCQPQGHVLMTLRNDQAETSDRQRGEGGHKASTKLAFAPEQVSSQEKCAAGVETSLATGGPDTEKVVDLKVEHFDDFEFSDSQTEYTDRRDDDSARLVDQMTTGGVSRPSLEPHTDVSMDPNLPAARSGPGSTTGEDNVHFGVETVATDIRPSMVFKPEEGEDMPAIGTATSELTRSLADSPIAELSNILGQDPSQKSAPQTSSEESGQQDFRVKKDVEEICAEHPSLLSVYSELSRKDQHGDNSVMQLTLPSFAPKKVKSKPKPVVKLRLNSFDHHCDLCNKNLKGRRGLHNHMLAHILPRLHICDVCNKTFRQKRSLLGHQQSEHQSILNYTCETCGKKYISMALLEKHNKATHLRVGQCVCHLCGLSLSSRGNLNRHLQWHTGTKTFSCRFCGKKFFQNSLKKSHERTHTGEVPWCCDVCGRGFQTPGLLRIHLDKHESGTIDNKGKHLRQGASGLRGRYGVSKQRSQDLCKCDICGLSFKGKRGVIHHMKKHMNGGREAESLKCDLCGMILIGKSALTQHKEVVHNVVTFKFKCEQCDKGFKTYAQLFYHRRLAHQSRPDLSCEICNRTFATTQTKELHARIHTGEKPLTCDVCGKKFSWPTNLKRHLRVHTGEKPFECDICGRAFSQSNAVKEHRKTHGKKTNITASASLSVNTDLYF